MDGLRVSQGLTQGQIKELITFSNNDPQVVKFTHDPERFKDLSAFKKWLPGKTVYSFTGTDKKLMGVTWFEDKINPKAVGCQFTFAIRIYPPLRGKGYSEVLMKDSFDKFTASDTYQKAKMKGFWLSTRSDNGSARRLYLKFGFKEKVLEGNYILMTYQA